MFHSNMIIKKFYLNIDMKHHSTMFAFNNRRLCIKIKKFCPHMLREWRWMMHCHIPKMLMAVKHMNHHFLNITNTTIYFKIETFLAEIIVLWNLFEDIHDNIFFNKRIHDWFDVALYTAGCVCILTTSNDERFNCCNMFLFNDLNRKYSCIYENTKHEQLFLIHI